QRAQFSALTPVQRLAFVNQVFVGVPPDQRVLLLAGVPLDNTPVAPLTRNDKLERAAFLWAQTMYGENIFPPDHVDPATGKGPLQRIQDQGYGIGATFLTVAENIAFGFQTPADVIAAWMNSPHHMPNILNTRIADIGLVAGIRDTATASGF